MLKMLIHLKETVIAFSCDVRVVSVLGRRKEGEEGKGGRRFYACLQAPCRKVQNDCEPDGVPPPIGVLCMPTGAL